MNYRQHMIFIVTAIHIMTSTTAVSSASESLNKSTRSAFQSVDLMGPPARLGSLVRNNQTALAQTKPEPPAKTPSRPSRPVQRLPSSLSLSRAESSEPTTAPELSQGSELPADPLALRNLAWLMTEHFEVARYYSEDLVGVLDYQAATAFEYVRDRIGFDPYPGTLRGAEGVLGARSGNAYDRSLLLSRLLEDMGYESRLVFGKLGSGDAERLLKRAVRQPPADRISPDTLLDERAHAQWLARARKDFNWLSSALKNADIGGEPGSATPDDVTDHVWVQARLDDGWTDLDSAFPDAEPGEAFAEIERYAGDTRPEDHHRVEISVVGEALSPKGLREETVLEVNVRAREAMHQHLFLHFKPYGKSMGRVITDALGPGARFRPVVAIDGKAETGKPFPGILMRPKDQSEGEQFFYGDELAVTSAVYLDIRVIRPDGSESYKRRPLFDRVDARDRRSGNLSRDRLKQVSSDKGVPLAYQEIHQLLISTGGLNPFQAWNDAGYAAWYIARLSEREGGLAKASFYEGLWALGMVQLSWLTLTEQLVMDALNDLDDARFFVAAPRVYVLSLRAGESDSGVAVRQTIDLMHDTVRPVALDSADAEALADRQMWYGVLQSALETMSGQAFTVAGQGEEDELASTSLASAGSAMVLASPGDIPRDASAPAALYRAVEAGSLALVPGAPEGKIRAWWTVSADTAATSAMLAPGLGGSIWHNRWIGPNPQLRARGSIGGVAGGRGSFYLPKDWDKQFLKGKAKKVKTSPPPNCRSGGTEYQTLTCGVALSTITSHTLVIANVGLAMLIGIMVVLNALRPEMEITNRDD